MKRVAIPVTYGNLSEYFGRCCHYEIFEIDGGQIKSSSIEIPSEKEITKLLPWIADRRISDVIAFKVDKRMVGMFCNYKINLYLGIQTESPHEIIQDYINGSLKSDGKIIAGILNEELSKSLV